jgi:hypothetical protein
MINTALFCVLIIYFFKDSHNHIINVLFKNSFLIDGEDWIIIGNKKTEFALHQAINIDSKMSNYIVGKDNLINVDWKNKDDKDLWYFKSPPIKLPNSKVSLLTFTMRSFSGDFSKLNYCHALIKICGKTDTFIYPYVKKYDGKMMEFNIPLINKLWILEDKNNKNKNNNNNNLFDNVFKDEIQIEILGDWTHGVEIIGIDNIQIL